MKEQTKQYKQLETFLTAVLILDAVLFLIYLFSAGLGIVWLKVLCTICTLLISGGILYILYITKELLRPRSFWITVGAGAIVVCLLFSLLLHFPCPAP